MMRRITLKVFTADCKQFEPYVFTAPPGREFTQAAARDLVARFMGHVNDKFPQHVFRVVACGRGQYNVIPIPQTSAHA